MKKLMFITMILCLTVSMGLASTFNVADGDWFVDGNWDPAGVPTTTDVAEINGGRVANIASGSATAEQLQLGVGSNGTLNISGGTLTTGAVDKSVWIGNAGATGTLNMTSGQIVSNSRVSIGGEFNNNAAAAVVNLSGDAKISQVGGTGHAAIGFGSGSVVDIAMSGTSEIAFTALTSAQYVDMRLGDITVNQSDNSRFYSSGNLRLGSALNADAQGVDWAMTGGTIEVGNGFYIYNTALNVGGDGAVFADSLIIGNNSKQYVNVSGNGTLNLRGQSATELEAMFGSLITGDGLATRTVDIGGTEYTQVYVPEPATLILLGCGAILLKRRKN